jgi:Mn2+/Fe2+ NRAMP family transporter
VTGAADDDPSGIATYSQAGAQFGFGTLWTLFLTTPLMIAIQILSARIGQSSGHGLITNMKRQHGRPVLALLVTLLLVANIFNIAADIAAMGEALRLVVGGPEFGYSAIFAAVMLGLQLFVPYAAYARMLKWLTLVLFVYVAAALSLTIDWGAVLRAFILPPLRFDSSYMTMIVAVLGTTISPYLFFWQAGQEVEDARLASNSSERDDAAANQARIGLDTTVGMLVSNIVAAAIVITTAGTLHAHGLTDIQTSGEAAAALRPIAGEFAFLLFALGIVGTGLLAVPVLAGSAAYAVAELFDWPSSLSDKPMRARGFYGVIVFAMLVGIAVDYAPIDPVRMLVWSAVVNGVVAAPMMIFLMRLTNDPKAVGLPLPGVGLRLLGWTATAFMAGIVLFLGWTLFF